LGKSRLRALLDHFGRIKDSRDPQRITRPLAEVLPLVVCGAIAECDDYEAIAARGAAHVGLLGITCLIITAFREGVG